MISLMTRRVAAAIVLGASLAVPAWAADAPRVKFATSMGDIVVESSSTRPTSPRADSAVRASNLRPIAPDETHRQYQLSNACQESNSAGGSRGEIPTRAKHNSPSMTRRLAIFEGGRPYAAWPRSPAAPPPPNGHP